MVFDRLCPDLWKYEPDHPWALEEALVMSLLFVATQSEAAGAKINTYFERLQQEET